MSSPARSSVSATSGGHGGGSSSNVAFCDDASPYHFPPELISAHDRKEEALSGSNTHSHLHHLFLGFHWWPSYLFGVVALKSELMTALQKEVKSLDEDSWMFSRPRSQINLISRPGNPHSSLEIVLFLFVWSSSLNSLIWTCISRLLIDWWEPWKSIALIISAFDLLMPMSFWFRMFDWFMRIMRFNCFAYMFFWFVLDIEIMFLDFQLILWEPIALLISPFEFSLMVGL